MNDYDPYDYNQEEQPPRKQGGRGMMSILLILMLVGFFFLFGKAIMNPRAAELSISEFETHCNLDHVKSTTSVGYDLLRGEFVQGVNVDGKTTYEVKINERYYEKNIDAWRSRNVERKNPEGTQILLPIEYKHEQPNLMLQTLLYNLLPWVLIIGLFWFFFLRQVRGASGPGGILSFGQSRAYMVKDKTGITFNDVAGVDEAKEELKEIVDFLRYPDRFKKLGARIPHGVLLIGHPGTGKTLLAKAIAGEAKVPFFSISGSDFVEMFVGVGASRVRDLFKRAKAAAPCIIFLDEIDAVGRKRGSGIGGGHDEREQTLNAILVEMDGFAPNQGIIVIAATNRPDVLDPALRRPGRFDREVTVDLPDMVGREQILKVHAGKIVLATDVDLKKIAQGTPTFSGAELANLVNEAALLAARKERADVAMADLWEARDKVRWGRAKKSRVMEEEDQKVTAYHEAGHAVATTQLTKVDPLHKVSIIPRGMALGATMSLPEKDRTNYSRLQVLNEIKVLYGGRIAEELFCEDISSGAQNDIDRATRLAKLMVTEWGMSTKLGPINYTTDDPSYGYYNGGKIDPAQSPDLAAKIDREVQEILLACYNECRQVLEKNRQNVENVAKALLKYEVLEAEEVHKIIAGADITTLKPEPAERVLKTPKQAEAERLQQSPAENLSSRLKDSLDIRPRPQAG